MTALVKIIKILLRFFIKMVWGILFVVLLFVSAVNLYRAISAENWVLSEASTYDHVVGKITKSIDSPAIMDCFLLSPPVWNPYRRCSASADMVTISFTDKNGLDRETWLFLEKSRLSALGSEVHVLYKKKAEPLDPSKLDIEIEFVPDIYSLWWHVELWIKAFMPLLICFAPKLIRKNRGKTLSSTCTWFGFRGGRA